MEYLGFDVGYGWWKPAASKMQPLQDMQIRDDPKKGLHDVRSFVGACNFYRRHIHNFTYSSAPLTDLIKKTTPWRWTSREEECFQELKKKIASSNCLGVPRPEGEIVLITDASDVGGGGTIYQWQELNPAELTHCHYRTTGLNRDGSLKHDYPTSERRLVPLGHWNWKWNQARSNYSTYDQELLAGIEAFGGRATSKLPFTACTTSNPQTHEIQVFHLHSRLSKGFCDPCLGHDTIWRPGQGDEGICRQRKHVDK